MGGLVAKYYLDVLCGWEHCRALITFGTPFRGTLAALDVLANGVHALGTRLNAVSDVLGAFTSVHQLLPRYPVLLDRSPGTPPGQRPGHVHLSPVRLGTLDPARASAAYQDFHRRMDTHSPGPAAPLLPVVGYGHRTAQTAVFDGKRLRITTDPAALGADRRQFATGDWSVPAVAAIPVEAPASTRPATCAGSPARPRTGCATSRTAATPCTGASAGWTPRPPGTGRTSRSAWSGVAFTSPWAPDRVLAPVPR